MRLIPFVLVLMLMTLAGAETAPRVRILVLPLKIHWGERELSPRHFFEVLKHQVEKQAPRANLVIPSPEDPRLQGVDLSRRPSKEEALALGRTFHAPLVISLDIRFNRKVEERTQGRLLNVGALALVTIVEESSGKVLMEEPVAVAHSDHCQGQPESTEFEEQAAALTMETARDLARLIVTEAQKKKPQLTP